MRPPENAKSNYGAKAPSTVQAGTLIRLPIKKIYCSKCHRLVKGQAQGSNGATQISCPRCGQRLWFQGSLSWRSTGKGLDVSS